ncbi:MAG: PorT family protein [Bacteroidales bacterium]|nr:PorT family protein [Bacteroidales bacterium]
MKKIVTSLCILLMAGAISFSASAKGGIIFKGGLSYSNLNLNEKFTEQYKEFTGGEGYKNFTGWHFGVGFQSGTAAGFSVQPELLYNAKGSVLGDKLSWNLKYLELPINIQWGPDLVAFRPYIMASPFLGYCISNKLKVNKDNPPIDKFPELNNLFKDANKLEYGVGVGIGFDISRIQIALKYNWNFGTVADIENIKSVGENIKGITKTAANSLEISLGLKF